MECVFCHKAVQSSVSCRHGHYVCDRCHESQGLVAIRRSCLASGSRNPQRLAIEIMRSPYLHLHGPEHHTLVGAVLLTSYANAGGAVCLPEALEEMERRGREIPGGICGMYGCCGAAMSAGAFFSLITKTTPLSEESWGLANLLTSRCLSEIGRLGGPRCCKRDSFTAIRTAAAFTAEHTGVQMEWEEPFSCSFFSENQQCIRSKCPYFPK